MKSGKITSIQMLRGIASLSVLFAHMSHKLLQKGFFTQDHFKYGSWGVEIFFIISGFIMMFITSGNIKKGQFLLDRVVRIIPLYWFFSVIALGIYFVVPDVVNSSGGNTGVFQSFLLLPIPLGTKFLVQNGWTLTYEFLFYFSILLFLNQSDDMKFWGILLLFSLADVFLKTAQVDLFIQNPIKYEFLFGLSIFYIYKKRHAYALWSGLVTTLAIICIHGQYVRPLGLTAFCAIILVLLLVVNESRINDDSPYVKFLFGLGEISFSLYLLHPFTIQATSIIFKFLKITNSVFFILFALIISIWGAYYFYNFFEIKATKLIKSKLMKA